MIPYRFDIFKWYKISFIICVQQIMKSYLLVTTHVQLNTHYRNYFLKLSFILVSAEFSCINNDNTYLFFRWNPCLLSYWLDTMQKLQWVKQWKAILMQRNLCQNEKLQKPVFVIFVLSLPHICIFIQISTAFLYLSTLDALSNIPKSQWIISSYVAYNPKLL